MDVISVYSATVWQTPRGLCPWHRFIPALASFLGISVTEIPVKHHPRIHGETKYSLDRIYRVILDLITVRVLLDLLTRPIQVFGTRARCGCPGSRRLGSKGRRDWHG